MPFLCWNCKTKLPNGLKKCPYCDAVVDEAVINQMDTIVDGLPTVQILPGVTVNGRYDVLARIGQGGMGVVFSAKDKILDDKIVALKVIPYELSMDRRTIADLKKETAIAIQLTHENIVRLHNLESWEGLAYIVMEYVDGGTLSDYLVDKGGRLTIEEAFPIIGQIAKAIDYAHTRPEPVIHRDLKPLNVLMTKEKQPKIADYGLARVLMDSASRISVKDTSGTLSYMAPEQLRGKGIGRWTDIYAFAAMTYDLLAGHPPFYTGDLQWQIVHEDSDYIEGVKDHVNKALMIGLSKKNEQRPKTCSELIHMIEDENFLADIILTEKQEKKDLPIFPKQISDKTSKKANFPKIGLILTGLLIFFIAACGLWFFQKGGLSSEPALKISTIPEKANVYIDDGHVGESPVEIKEIPVGAHLLKITSDKYKEYTETLFIQKDKPRTLSIDLKPKPFGDVKITSVPSGAAIYIDNKHYGTTPAMLEDLPQGKYDVRLTKDEFNEWKGETNIVPLKPGAITAELISIYGNMHITSIPSEAEVLVDGSYVGRTPLTIDKIKQGRHEVEIRKQGYDTWTDTLKIVSLEVSDITANLVSIYGSLEVSSNPSGANLYLDGKDIGKTPYRFEEIKKGVYKVKVVKNGYQDWQKSITVSALKSINVKADLVDLKSDWQEPLTGMEFVWVKGGCYQMGSDSGSSDEKPVHEVCVDGFWMGKYEVTNAQYRKFKSSHDSKDDNGHTLNNANQPAVYVSWEEAKAYADWLTKRSGFKFRLPTEAQWEYACRAGTQTKYYWGDNIDANYVNFSDKNDPSGPSRKDIDDGYAVTSPVGSFRPNSFGLHDMLGNVWEWCEDWYSGDAYKKHAKNNPVNNSGGSHRVIRGGSWYSDPSDVRCALRFRVSPGYRSYDFLGFRLLRTVR